MSKWAEGLKWWRDNHPVSSCLAVFFLQITVFWFLPASSTGMSGVQCSLYFCADYDTMSA